MDIFLYVIIISFISGVVSTGIGGLVGAIFKKDSSRVVSLLLSFAGGVMLSIVAFDLVPEALQPEGATTQMPIYLVVLGIILGYAVVYLLNYVIDKHTEKEVEHIDESHPKTADDLDELIHSDHLKKHNDDYKQGKSNKKDLFWAGIIMACALALHNLPEGMVIGASYSGSDQVLSGRGFLLALVLGLHDIPEGMAISVPLISGGMKKWKAVLLAGLSGLPTVIGAIIGFSLGLISPIWLALSLSFASGAMLYVVFGELIPESILMWKSKMPILFLFIGFLTGLILVFA